MHNNLLIVNSKNVANCNLSHIVVRITINMQLFEVIISIIGEYSS